MKVVKSAEHYTETALDEIKLLKSVMWTNNLVSYFLCFRQIALIRVSLRVIVSGAKHRPR